MFNIFDHPWGIVTIACAVFLITMLVRPLRVRWPLWLIPPALILAAFAIDQFVQSDNEKIAALLQSASTAIEDADPDAIAPLIADDYTDSYHLNKTVVMRVCTAALSRPLIDRTVTRLVSTNLAPDGSSAKVFFTSRVVFDKQSGIAQEYDKNIALFQFEANLRRTPAGNWLFAAVEVVRMDSRPVSRRNLR